MAKERPVTVDGGALPKGSLHLLRLEGMEELGRPFAYQLDLVSADEAISLEKVVGQPMAVHIDLPDGKQRHLHGLVTRFAQQGWEGRRALYRATLRPSLWLLAQRAGCRIFQERSVPQVVKAIVDEYGFPCEQKLDGSYPAREYVVQYRETDLAFVSRLLEAEGIYYFFRHEAGKHTLVLADAMGAHAKAAGYEKLPFYPPQQGQRRERDHLDTWRPWHQLEPTAFALRDHDFTHPRASLEVRRAGQGRGRPELEIYDYPGGYVANAEGERYARTRLEEAAARAAQVEGAGNARGLACGALFELTGHPRQDQDREHLIVSAAMEARLPDLESDGGAGADDAQFRCRVVALDSRTPFRPARATPRPVVQGPQTARVVGKSGEEIWTDKYGRVMVEFPWDRVGQGDEKSSCWVRVAQAWAGATWGAMHIPRIGQEVVVQFLEGDPDRPIVAGHLHDADHMPPYELPAHQTQSGFKSRSTKGGGHDNANELRFEDKKGEEQLYLQAEKDYELVVKNDAKGSIGHDQKHEVKNDETHDVGHDRKLTVKNDETTSIEKNRTETVGQDETITVRGKRTATVDKDEAVTVAGARTLSVGKDAKVTVSGAQTETVGKDLTVTVSGGRQATVGKDDAVQVGKALKIRAGEQIVLQVGAAKLTLKADGTVTLEGVNVTVKGAANVNVKASGVAVVKGSVTKVN